MIIGIGTDIVNIQRIKKIYEKYAEGFLERNFHIKEIEQFNILSENKRIAYLAKRFAGKEAIAKALGTGIGKIAFKNIAILNNDQGAPFAIIDSHVKQFDKNMKINISLSDEELFAIAFVVISG